MTFKRLMHVVRMTARSSRRKTGFASAPSPARENRKHMRQRCAVRITYSANRVKGQWAAHGRYLMRESAIEAADLNWAGFDGTSDGVEASGKLAAWQRAGDPRIFKLILSPEFGERLDLKAL